MWFTFAKSVNKSCFFSFQLLIFQGHIVACHTTLQGQVLPEPSELEGDGRPGSLEVIRRCRMVRRDGKSDGFLLECRICSPASHIFTRHRSILPNFQKLVCNMQKSWELRYSFQPVQYKETKWQWGKLLLEYSSGVWWAHCPAVSAHNGTYRTAGSSFHRQLATWLSHLSVSFMQGNVLQNVVKFGVCKMLEIHIQWPSAVARFLIVKGLKNIAKLFFNEAIITGTVYAELFLLTP